MKKNYLWAIILLIIFSVSTTGRVWADDIDEGEPAIDVSSHVEYKSAAAPAIDAGAAIVVDMQSGRVLYEKNAYKKVSIASTTKIMTGIVAIENGNLSDIVTVSAKAAGMWGSRMKLKAGQKLTLEALLYGLLMRSGNDAAVAIAEHIGGSVEGFLEMMNQKASMLGAKKTHFMSPHGLDMQEHYSTAYDLAMITRHALQNPVFSKIVGTKNTVIEGYSLYNTNEMLGSYPGADGVKTGYTGQAGRCLVTSVTKNGWRVISVMLNCSSRSKRAYNSKLILDYAFNNYKPYRLLEEGKSVLRLPVIKGIHDSVEMTAVEDVVVPLKEDEVLRIETQLDVPKRLDAPVGKWIEQGYIHFMLDGEVIGQSALKTSEAVARKGYGGYLGDVIDRWIRMFREGMFFTQ